MAIGTNDTIHKFGTQTQITASGPGAVSSGSFSVAGDVNDWTNSDDAPFAAFVLVLQDLSAAPSAGEVINLYAKPLNIVNTTGDHQGPNSNVPTIYLGSFAVDTVDPAATDDNYALGPVALPNTKSGQEYEFYIENATSVGIDAADWELWITPVTYGPA
jgi:hypothetical protein